MGKITSTSFDVRPNTKAKVISSTELEKRITPQPRLFDMIIRLSNKQKA